MSGRELRLLGNLIDTTAGSNLTAVIDREGDGLPIVQFVSLVVTTDIDGLTVDEAIERKRCVQRVHLVNYLLHLRSGQRHSVELVDTGIVLIEDMCPVVEQILLGAVLEDTAVPTFGGQKGYQVAFKCQFAIVIHSVSYLQTFAPRELVWSVSVV